HFYRSTPPPTSRTHSLSLHDALPILFSPVLPAQESTPAGPPIEPQGPQAPQAPGPRRSSPPAQEVVPVPVLIAPPKPNGPVQKRDRKSTRLNSSHDQISYAVFCLKKK